MLKVNFINLGSEIYYTEMLDNQQGSYYVKNHGSCGVFRGNGSAELGIENKTIVYEDNRFLNLINGKSVDGKTQLRTIYKERTYFYLTDPNTKRKTTISRKKAEELVTKDANKYHQLITHKTHKPIGCIDLTFHAPKSFSIYYALAPTKIAKQKVLNAFQNALNDTISAIEHNCFIRKGKNGVRKESAKVILADFIHHVARPTEKHKGGDMQLHCHRLVVATAQGKNGKWGAIDTVALNEARYTIGQAFINNLRYRTQYDLGLATYDRQLKHGTTFGIKGISQELEQEFSQRSKVIYELVDDSMTPAQIDKLVLKSRLKKVSDYPDYKLLEDWRNRALKHGFVWEEVALIDRSLQPQEQQKSQPITSSEATLTPIQELQPVSKADTSTKTQEPQRKQISPKERERLYRTLATDIQTSQFNGGFKRNYLLDKILEQSQGSFEYAQAIAKDFERNYTRPSRVKSRLRLNRNGHKLIDFPAIRSRIADTIEKIQQLHKELKNFGISAKMLYLYSTGQISRKQWLIICERKKLYRARFHQKITRKEYVLKLDKIRKNLDIPDYVFLIKSYEAAGILSQKNSRYWSSILLEAKNYQQGDRVRKRLATWEKRMLKIGGSNKQSHSQRNSIKQH